MEFFPQILFLTSIFFYLIILIFYKWTHFAGNQATDAPLLLIRKRISFLHRFLTMIVFHLDLINMMLLSYPSGPSSSRVFYSNQRTIQTILLLVAMICIPWMLLGKPIYMIILRRQHR